MPRKPGPAKPKKTSRPPKGSRPGTVHLQIIELMKRFPAGITGGQIRQKLGLSPEKQTHLDKRKRELRRWFVIRKSSGTVREDDGRSRKVTLYHFEGELGETETPPVGRVNNRIRAQIIHSARGRCQMCGRTIAKHGIVLVVDHKKPLNWGGDNEPENLWAICEDCNGGKKAFFSSVETDDSLMRRVTAEESVHVRLGETLKAFGIGKAVPAYLLDIVADQEDWQKRLRELRYPVIGWNFSYKRYKEGGRVRTNYILQRFRAWPEDPSGAIRAFEKQRMEKNRSLRAS